MITRRCNLLAGERSSDFASVSSASALLSDAKSQGTNERRRCSAISAAVLCGVGLTVVLGEYWLMADAKNHGASQPNNPAVELRMLQPLITGNLAVFLCWIWLDLRAPGWSEEDWDARFGIWFLAATMAAVSAVGSAAWAGVIEREPFVPFLLFLMGPVLVVTIPLLWSAARRIEQSWLRALILAGVVAASAIAQLGHNAGNDAELRVFSVNSCLIGLAVTVWLLTWAIFPAPRRIA